MTPKAFLRSQMLRLGIWLARSARERELAEFISRLKPLSIHRPLVRLGPDKDGGYLLPDDLEGIGACISPGVSEECGFDLEIARLGIDVHLADASVEGPPARHERFHFTKTYIDIFNSDNSITLDDYCKDVAPGKDLLLQMDVEGAEYRILSSISSELLTRFRIMVIEFHSLEQLWSRFGLAGIKAVFLKLLQTHRIVHIHPNNTGTVTSFRSVVVPSTLEMTFYRKDRADFEAAPRAYPHPLDRKNVPERKDIPLPTCWR